MLIRLYSRIPLYYIQLTFTTIVTRNHIRFLEQRDSLWRMKTKKKPVRIINIIVQEEHVKFPSNYSHRGRANISFLRIINEYKSENISEHCINVNIYKIFQSKKGLKRIIRGKGRKLPLNSPFHPIFLNKLKANQTVNLINKII